MNCEDGQSFNWQESILKEERVGQDGQGDQRVACPAGGDAGGKKRYGHRERPEHPGQEPDMTQVQFF